MGKQLELRGTIHRCRWCKREIRNPKSIKRKAGIRCYKKHKQSGLCGKAQ